MKRFVALLLITILLLSTTAMADVTLDEPVVNGDNSQITITGTAVADAGVMLVVADKDIAIEDIKDFNTTAEKVNSLVYVAQTFANEDGSFSFVFTMPKDKKRGKYEYHVADGSSSDTYVFDYYSQDDVVGVLGELDALRIKKAETSEEIQKKTADVKKLLLDQNNRKLLKINTVYYNNTSIDELNDYVFEQIGNYAEKIETASNLNELIRTYHALYLAKTAEDEDVLEHIITDKCKEVFNWKESPLYKEYDEKSDYRDVALADVLAKADEINSPEELVSTMEKAILLSKINSCESWSQIKAIADTYNTIVILEGEPADTDFANVSVQIPFDTYDLFVEELNKQIALEDKDDDDDNNSNYGGGSSSSNRGSVSVKGGSISVPYIQPLEKLTNPFTDLDEYAWADEAITSLYSADVIDGKTETTFDPASNVTREEFVKMLITALNISPTDADVYFEDVISGSWYEPYVNIAYENGIVKGISSTQFGVGSNITRQDMVVMIYNAIQKYISNDKSKRKGKFTDLDTVSEYAKQAVTQVRRVGIVSGMPDGSFAPAKYCQRAEAAQIIYNMKKYICN